MIARRSRAPTVFRWLDNRQLAAVDSGSALFRCGRC